MHMRLRVGCALFAAGVLLGAVSPASSQFVLPLQNPSAQSAGMGGASTAVVWSGDLNLWANPALLGYSSGFTVRWSGASLTYGDPPLPYRADGVAYGWGGLGLGYGHERISVEGLLFPYDTPFEYSVRLRRWGGAISVSRVLGTVLGDAAMPGIARHADLAVGFAHKHLETRSVPPMERWTSNATDFGLVVRVTPFPETGVERLHLDLTYGYAVLKEPYEQLFSGPGVTPRHLRHGVGARVGLPISPGDGAGQRRILRWLAGGEDPVLTLTIAADFDRENRTAPFGGSNVADFMGGEVNVANALAFRFGHVWHESQGLDSFCFGVGVALPITRFARARYDYARFPSRGGLDDEMGNRHTVSGWLDPIAMVRP